MFRIKFSREIILKILYQIDVNKEFDKNPEKHFEKNSLILKGVNEVEMGFIKKIVDYIIKNTSRIDKLISQNLIGWKIERLTPIDRNLLRMGIAESNFNDKKAVIIDDIIRIAKKYSEKDSYKIINAILDKVIK